ncbi:hypothetical protein MJN85_30420, partial [Salmonella enterica subsp. enterica serovar Anatum]|nr:hypothetical protein [Salmonella enterica subsp. enterica serovar Anatum]
MLFVRVGEAQAAALGDYLRERNILINAAPIVRLVTLFDRYDAGEQAVLVHIYFSQDKDMEDLQEFESLVSSAGVEAM